MRGTVERTLEMDIFRPKNDWGQLPAIVCVHGGGWRKGSKIHHRKVAQTLAAKGFVAASINYRLSGEAPFPAQIHDCKAAVRFLRANANKYGIDSDHIGAIGHSAGGHLVALLATSAGISELEGDGGNSEFSSAIQAVVPMGGQTDLMSERTLNISSDRDRGGIWRQFLGGSQKDTPETYRIASPLIHLDKTDPPCLIITGGNDDESTRAERFRQQMRELNLQAELRIIDEAPHPFLETQVWFDIAMDAAGGFFVRHLKNSMSDALAN